jgi:hypothetical protein
MSDGVPEITGAVVSCTITWNDVLELFDNESVAVHVTNVVPNANVDPDTGSQSTGSVPSTASVAVGAVHDAFAPDDPVASTVRSDGVPEITGADELLEVTKTVNVAVPLFPWESCAVHDTTVWPTGKVLPEAGAHWTVTVPSTRSLAVGGV